MPSKSRTELIELLTFNKTPKYVIDRVLNMTDYKKPFLIKIFKGLPERFMKGLGVEKFYECLTPKCSDSSCNTCGSSSGISGCSCDPSFLIDNKDMNYSEDGTPYYNGNDSISLKISRNMVHEETYHAMYSYEDEFMMEECRNCSSPFEKCKLGYAGCMMYEATRRPYKGNYGKQNFVKEHDCEDTSVPFHSDYLEIHRRVWRKECIDEFNVIYRGIKYFRKKLKTSRHYIKNYPHL